MIKFENDCVGCDLPCIGDACSYRNVIHLYCDECKADVEVLYDWSANEHLCEDCLVEKAKDEVPKITYENYHNYVEEKR